MLEEAKTAIKIVHGIRNAELKPLQGDFHPFCKLGLSKHPFEKIV
jgi:UDP-N-acetyl-2-amino-2-deoxyglucuronate dehydrogenase